jgi:hypothetical protein
MDPNQGTFYLSSLGYSYDMFITKLDVSGNFIWARQIGGGYSTMLSCLAKDNSGNIYSTGWFEGSTDFDPGSGTYYLTASGYRDAYVCKLDATGNLVFAGQFQGLSCTGSTIFLDASGNIYTGGWFTGNVDFDPSIGTYYLSASSGNFHSYINKLDPAGNHVWTNHITGNSIATPAITVDQNSNVYSTGNFYRSADFNPSLPSCSLTTLSSPTNYIDAFIARWSPNCVAPPDPVNTTNQNVCSGKSATLTANGTGGINWYGTPTSTLMLGSGSVYTVPVQPLGTYTVYAEVNTCMTSLNRTPVTYTVHAIPTVSVMSTTTIVCSGESVTLSASGATSYSWGAGTGQGPNHTVILFSSTNYTVRGANMGGCSNTATVGIKVLHCLEIEELESDKKLQIYPNPNNGNFFLNTEHPRVVNIYNVTGQLVHSQYLMEGENALHLSHLPSGIYLLRTDGDPMIIRMVKE